MNRSEPPLWLRLCLSLFGTGYIKWAGGTLASTLALIPVWFLWPYPWITGGIVVILAASGVLGGFLVERAGWRHDDPRITIDEFSGMMAATILLPRPTALWGMLLILGLAFLAFRLLDILKPWPISTIERLPGGWGVMGDDLVAGLLANGIVQLTRLLPHGWLYV